MKKNKPINIRMDLLSELLLEELKEQEGGDKSKLIRKAIYEYAIRRLPEENMKSLVQISVNEEKI